MKGKNLKERGITLIALVITIIVLLILAGVTLNILLNTGIIDNTQNAVDKYAYEQQREEDALKSLSGYMHSYSNVVPIYTAEQLKKIGTGGKVNIEQENTEFDFSMNANYVLMADIDLNPGKWSENKDEEKGITYNFNGDAEQWTPIGTLEKPFTGTFNGNGHTISGIYINKPEEDCKGLFGVIEDSTIENLTVSGSITGNESLGGIAGQANGKIMISNCLNKSNIGANYTWAFCGGIIGGSGSNNIKIECCGNEGKIEGVGNNVGGIAGGIEPNESGQIFIENCYNAGNVTGNGRVAGIIGRGVYVVINFCYNKGNINGLGPTGGIGGDIVFTNINSCYNKGDIIAPNSSGGIVGAFGYASDGEINNSYNIGSVQGDENVGGIVAILYRGNIKNCYYLTDKASVGIYRDDTGKSQQAESKTEAEMTDTTEGKSFVDILNNGETNWKEDKKGTEAINDGYPILSWQEK